MSGLLIQRARLVPVTPPTSLAGTGIGRSGGTADNGPVDVLVRDDRVVSVTPTGTADIPNGTECLDAEGRPLIPGLWDKHVHMTQWARTAGRLDVSGAAGPADVIRRVAAHVATLPSDRADAVVIGWGHRTAGWDQAATVAGLDGVSGAHPVILISGDGHSGWLNSAALRLLGAGEHTTALDENDWFPVFSRMSDLRTEESLDDLYRLAITDAHARGVTGIVDMEFDAASGTWAQRAGLAPLRVRVSVYPDRLQEVLRDGRRTGQPWEDTDGLVTMGALKIISDGSLGTRTAYCCEPYPDGVDPSHPRGKANVTPKELRRLLGTARQHDLAVALHAIGDAAVGIGLDAFEQTGAVGAIEHAQLVRPEDIPRMARLGLTASVQPAHLLDDRDLITRCWPGREDRCFPLRSLIDANVPLALGSDAPVAPLDPWLAMAAAVHRSGDERPPWVPQQAITAAEALGSSTDGWATITPGHPGDLALLDDDPLPAAESSAEAAAALRGRRADVTIVAGRVVHDVR